MLSVFVLVVSKGWKPVVAPPFQKSTVFDFRLVELAWDNTGKCTGSSNHEKPHNSSAGQVRSGPVSAPEAAVMPRLQFRLVLSERCKPSRYHPRFRSFSATARALFSFLALHPAALASVPYGIVLVRVRVRVLALSTKPAPPFYAIGSGSAPLLVPRIPMCRLTRRNLPPCIIQFFLCFLVILSHSS